MNMRLHRPAPVLDRHQSSILLLQNQAHEAVHANLLSVMSNESASVPNFENVLLPNLREIQHQSNELDLRSPDFRSNPRPLDNIQRTSNPRGTLRNLDSIREADSSKENNSSHSSLNRLSTALQLNTP